MFKKREKRLEKNKVLFLNYLIKFIFVKHNFRFTILKIKNFTISSLLVLKKINFFKKYDIQLVFYFLKSNDQKVKRKCTIKKRIKKRLYKYEI